MSMIGIGIALLFMLLIIAAVTIGIILLLKLSKRTDGGHEPHPHQPVSHALAILDERFAKGEISIEEYKKMKEELKTK